MGQFASRLRSYGSLTDEGARPSPRMADVALEVLQNLDEEAKDVVYYDALHRVHAAVSRNNYS